MEKLTPLAQEIWDMKYRFRRSGGEPAESAIEDSWRRVAAALAEPEADSARWERVFYGAMEDFRFLPAGRILAGAGTKRAVTLFNCFVMGVVPDDMGGIFEHLREAALTLQQGGGIGYDFSTLRPKGALVRGVGADASGPLSFMDVWDAMCRTIMSAGHRRGAMMATLRCDHPDIEAFIEAKREPGRLRMFNLSVLVTDDFMRAVEQDAGWPLTFEGTVYKSVSARTLWDRIMRSTYDYAEPGVIFIDRINRRNNLYYCEDIRATNPCGEQPLPPYGACDLGSINLTRLVRDPFTDAATLDTDALAGLVPVAVRMLDNVIDISNFPLDAQRQEAVAKRRIGVGVTGLADALIQCGLRYGSDEAIAAIRTWMGTIRREAYLASAALAEEKGAFPLYDKDAYLAGETVSELDADVREAIAAHGMRNALVTSIAPTGTISLLAGNVSSGIEPVFRHEFTRDVLQPDGSHETHRVMDYAVDLYRRMHGPEAPLPDTFVDAETLDPEAHVLTQAAVQEFVDSSISKTINLPEEVSFADFKGIYRRAYDLGCKGCTTYRPNPVTGSVLFEAPEEAPEAVMSAEPSGSGVVYMTEPLERPEFLQGKTYKLVWPDSDHAIYITVNDILEGDRRRPFEVFINSKNMEHYAWTVALTRMISAVFRRGGDVSFVVEELKAVFDPRGGQWMDGKYVPSLLAAIGEVIEQHMVAIGFLPPSLRAPEELPGEALREAVGGQPLRQCPKCGSAGLTRQEGCDVCLACGHSKCS